MAKVIKTTLDKSIKVIEIYLSTGINVNDEATWSGTLSETDLAKVKQAALNNERFCLYEGNYLQYFYLTYNEGGDLGFISSDTPAGKIFTLYIFINTGEYQVSFISQEQLVSGTNIKTINGTSLLGSGNISSVGSISQDSSNGHKLIVTSNGTPSTIIIPDNDTHYTTKLVVTNSTGTANASTTNGNTKLRLFDNNNARNTIGITGTGGTTVSSDDSGNITINSTNGGTTYTLPVATYSTLGGIKPWCSTTGVSTYDGTNLYTTSPAINSATTTSGRFYPICTDKNGRAYVNVPWTNTTYSNIAVMSSGGSSNGDGSSVSYLYSILTSNSSTNTKLKIFCRRITDAFNSIDSKSISFTGVAFDKVPYIAIGVYGTNNYTVNNVNVFDVTKTGCKYRATSNNGAAGSAFYIIAIQPH